MKVTVQNNTFKAATVFNAITTLSNGNTAVWTPTTGKKFRLLAYCIEVTADVSITAAGQRVEIKLQDGTTDIACKTAVLVPATAATNFGNNMNTGWRDLGGGILSSTINNVLNVNLSAGLTTGEVIVNVIGIEE